MKVFSHRSFKTPRGDTGRYRNPEQRIRELSRLLPLWPSEVEDLSLDGRRTLIARLERALRAERARGRGGHWAYDLARHAALHGACAIERDALRRLEQAAERPVMAETAKQPTRR